MAASSKKQVELLVQQSREEQARIAQKILGLREELRLPVGERSSAAAAGSHASGGGHRSSYAGGRGNLGVLGASAEEAYPDPPELADLREKIAELEGLLEERRAEAEALRSHAEQLQTKLDQVGSRKDVAVHAREEYENMSIKESAQKKKLAALQVAHGKKTKENLMLTKYIEIEKEKQKASSTFRKQEQAKGGSHRRQAASEEEYRAEHDRVRFATEVSLSTLTVRASHALAAGCARCVLGDGGERDSRNRSGRGEAASDVFLALRPAPWGGGILEVFDAPDAKAERAVLDLSSGSGAACRADAAAREIDVRGGGPRQNVAILCGDAADFAKWMLALHTVQLIGRADLAAALAAVGVGPRSAGSPGNRARGALSPGSPEEVARSRARLARASAARLDSQ